MGLESFVVIAGPSLQTTDFRSHRSDPEYKEFDDAFDDPDEHSL